MQKIVYLLVLISLIAAACGPEEGTGNDIFTPRQLQLLENTGDNLILPAFADLNEKAASLNSTMNALVSSPAQEGLDAVRIAWRDAYIAWQKAAFFQFGPATDQALIGQNLYPVNTSLIDGYVANGTYDLNTAGASFAKGFPALDYVLFGKFQTDQELITAIQEQPLLGNYLKDVTGNLSSTVSAVHTAWQETGGNYISTFRSNPGNSTGSGLSLLVNGWSQYIELHIRNAKVGIPNGNSVVTAERFGPFPEKSEAYYNRDISLDLLKTSLKQINDLYMGVGYDGTDGYGIYDYLVDINAQNGTLSNDFRDRITLTRSAADALTLNLHDTIVEEGALVTTVFNELKAVVALLKVDVVSALSISINYADNDGD